MTIFVNVVVVHCDTLLPETSVVKSSGMGFILKLCALHSPVSVRFNFLPVFRQIPPPALPLAVSSYSRVRSDRMYEILANPTTGRGIRVGS